LTVAVTYEKPFYVVRLEAFRKAGGDFLATLSSNTRSQVRRSLREYSSSGTPTFQAAQILSEAERMFTRLRTIHQEHWTRKGHAGAFGSRFAQDFHADLIRSRFQAGEIQIGEIRAGERELGYLYNFVFDGVVSNYQSAFLYGEQERHSPGLVSHCCAIQQNFERGMRCYDMLAGSQRYKQSLATDEGTMAWLVLQRPRLRFTLERLAKRAWDVVRRRRLR
jgi:CelD/BcsL family acetyltransferase involved in cellulose biosynthesis